MIERIFISSVQKEFSVERQIIHDYIRGDALLRRFFDVFIFEDLPAADRRADDVYLAELGRSALYIGLLGNEYGREDKKGLSPTHREFMAASQAGKCRLIYVKGDKDQGRDNKMLKLIRLAGDELIRRRFNTMSELQSAIYASLVQYLLDTGKLLTGPFDATAGRNSSLRDISHDKVRWFLALARSGHKLR